MWTRTRLWFASLLRRDRFDQELAEELAFHLRARAEHLQREGIPAADAERRARLEFGGAEKYKDQVRDVRLGVWLEQLRQDLRYGVRVLVRRPGFTVAATVTLALGIGATATVFALLDVVLLRPLPVRDPEELAHIYTSCRAGDVYCSSSYPEFLDYQAQSRAFVDMAAFDLTTVNVGAESRAWVAEALIVSTSYFSLLGVAPSAGQLLSPGWDVANGPVVVLAHRAWVGRLGGDPTVIGTTLKLSGHAFRIVGVAAPDFVGTYVGERPDLWIPFENMALLPAGARGDMLVNRDARWISGTIGRLGRGVTLAQAQAEMAIISDGLRAAYPTREGRFITVEPAQRAALPPSAAGDIRRFVILLMGGVSATLFIACANIAGLLLARGAARQREFELRRALGAGRGRLVRQLLAEYGLLALSGALGGLVVAHWATALLAAYDLPGAVSIASLDLGLNARVLPFAVVLLGLTGLVGVLPALGATRHIGATSPGRTTGEGTANLHGQRVLLAAQVAVTTVLLFGAGLFIRSLQHGLALDLGVSSGPVVMVRIAPALERYPPERTWSVLDEATSRLANVPGVEAVSVAMQPPFVTGSGFVADAVEGYARSADERMRFESNFVGPAYFRALGIEIRSGRAFTDADREGTPLVAVISDTMARRYWAGRNPVGSHFTSPSFKGPVEVVGVVRDLTVGLTGKAEPFVYLPLRQHPRFLQSPIPIVLLVRATSNPRAVAASLRGVLRAIDPSLPVTEVTTLDAQIADLLMPQRMGSALLSSLAGLTVVLVTVGVFGTVGYGVARRRREIGVRLALGARRSQVTGAMTRNALVPVAVGAIVGLGIALALGRLVSTFLYGIAPTDLLTLSVAIAILATTAGLASFVPAWRAAGISPTEVLNCE